MTLPTLDFSAPAQWQGKREVIDEAAGHIFDVASDGKHVVYSHGRHSDWGPFAGCECLCRPVEDIVLAATGHASSPIVLADHATWAKFSPDGRSIAFGNGACLNSIVSVNLAASDGSGVRFVGIGAPAFAGRFLYIADDQDGFVSLSRLQHPDGAAELLARFAAPPPGPGPLEVPLRWSLSPDGETVVYQDPNAGTWYLRTRLGTTVALPPIPGFGRLEWSPDGSWLVTDACQVIDEAGRATKICDRYGAHAFSADGKLLAIEEDEGTSDVLVDDLATGTIVRLPSPPIPTRRGPVRLQFTPDSKRIVIMAEIVAVAPSSGGSWTPLGPGGGNLSISQDSSVIFLDVTDPVASVGGAAPTPVIAPDGTRIHYGPFLEPAGGLDLAVYDGPDFRQMIARADMTGQWTRVPDGVGCNWSFAGAFGCGRSSSDPASPWNPPISEEVFFVPDDMSSVTRIADHVFETAIPTGDKLFYIRSTGGLQVVDLPAHSP